MSLEVLIVDEDHVVTYIHKSYVIASGLSKEPLIVYNGKEALNIVLNNSNDKVYLVLLDLNMPILNGWEFLDRIQNEPTDNVIVVVVTSSVNEEDRKRTGSYSHVKAYIEKPFDLSACDLIKNLPAVSRYFKN